MAQFFGTEDIKSLSKTSQTTLQWEAGSYLRIGGQAYNVTAALNLDLSTDIDTGSVSNDTIYYVYAVVSFGIVSLKYSLSNETPTGFDAYRKIGAFQTDGIAEIIDTSTKDSGSVGDVIQSMLSEEKFITQNGAGWVLMDGRSVAGSKYALETGNATVPDASGRFLRGKNNGSGTNPDGDVALGTAQSEATKINGLGASTSTSSSSVATGNHVHNTYTLGKAANAAGGAAGLNSDTGNYYDHWTAQYRNGNTTGNHAHTINSSSSTSINGGGNETRSANVTVNIFIKIEDIAI